jgi:hypothetical protein
MINCNLFYCKNKDTYPPFKHGLYLEEYFLKTFIEKSPKVRRIYIPALWTNFQIEGWFQTYKPIMQTHLDEWISQNPSETGYFTVVQYDDGPLLKLPENTIVYGACSNDVPIPLIYEDVNNTLESFTKKTFNEKLILCSFVGNITSNTVLPNVRDIIMKTFVNNNNFKMINSGGWTPNVNTTLQSIFINTTIDSKFAFAPRGYGRGSFRFFECFKLGTIPIYVWNDKNWLPFQNIINYEKLCISIHISEIATLENRLCAIDETMYNSMIQYYHEIEHLFELNGMTTQIISENV